MLCVNRNRRAFLRASGVCIGLPLLEAMPSPLKAKEHSATPIRLVCVGNEFGMYPEAFWPKETGRNYAMPVSLKPLEAQRENFTLFSHLDHGLNGGHFAVHTFLTGVKAAEAKAMAEGGISLDQKAAEFVGSRTRFSSLNIGSDDGVHGGPMMSWTRTGTRVPPISGPRELFRKLFVEEDEKSKAAAADRIELHNSILDVVLDDAKSLQKKISKTDRQKLEEYFSSVRDVELKLDLDRQWRRVSKPKAPLPEPTDEGLTYDLPKIYDLVALALQTDSTRVATIELGDGFTASDLGIKSGYHSLSHHGKVEATLKQLMQVEKYQIEQYARFLDKLAGIREPNTDGTLLDKTMVLFGSGMGNANSHTNSDLPIILAGGGFQHGEHKAYPKEGSKRVPLCNLFVSMLQRFGLEIDAFSTSTGTLSGLVPPLV